MNRIIGSRALTSALALAIPFSAPVLAQPGALDSSFGSGGIALVPVPNGPGNGAAKVLEQSNAEILVASDSGSVALLQSNGTLDTSFGNQGTVTVSASNGQALGIVDVQVQSNGQILVLGDISQPSCTDCARPKIFTHGLVARLNANGSVDTTFGNGGEISLTALGSTSSDSPSALLLQSNGFILVADTPASATSAEVLRFNTSGSPDATFGSGGIAKVSDTENIVALGLQSDDKIVVIGAGQAASRLLANGAADTGTASGTVTASTGYGAAIQSNDDYITGLPAAQSPSVSFQLGRFTLANTADATFSSPSINFETGSVNETTFSQNFAVGLQPNGDVLAVGRLEVQTGNRRFATSFGVARVLSDGALDSSFGTDGIVTTSFAGSTGVATAVTVETSGDILVGGVGVNASGTEVLAVGRYLSE